MHIIELLRRPWPWYVAGPLIGLFVPALLIMGNRRLGVSSSLRHIIAALGQPTKIAHRGNDPMTGLRPERLWRSFCAACLPAKVPFFQYDWKKEAWNLFFVAGILAGGWVAGHLLRYPAADPLMPVTLFEWRDLLTLKGLLLIVGGGFLVGFGTRYAGGCTSGHSIMGLSTLQWPSLVATICFMAGGFLMANVILPFILKL